MPSSRDLERQLSLAKAKLGEASEGAGFSFLHICAHGATYDETFISRAEQSAVAEAAANHLTSGVLIVELEKSRPGSGEQPIKKARRRKGKAD